MSTPIILRHKQYTSDQLASFRQIITWKEKDLVSSQLTELYEIDHPSSHLEAGHSERVQEYIAQQLGAQPDMYGDWIYFSWSGERVHTVPEIDYQRLRTNRNQLLISADEQQKLAQSCVAVVGLSIGDDFAQTMAYNGIGHTMKIADFDTLSTSNLNRIQGRISDVGEEKIEICSRQIYAVNPYQKIIAFPQGINDTNVDEFINSEVKPTVIFEAIDDFAMKIKLRLAAQKAKIPVVMITNLGDTMLIDIERYDKEEVQIFNGAIGSTSEEILARPLTEQDKVRYAVKIVSFEHLPTKALKTLLEINKTLVGRPQLASTVAMGGGMAAMIARHIILGHHLASGRYQINFAGAVGVSEEINQETEREEAINKLKKGFGL